MICMSVSKILNLSWLTAERVLLYRSQVPGQEREKQKPSRYNRQRCVSLRPVIDVRDTRVGLDVTDRIGPLSADSYISSGANSMSSTAHSLHNPNQLRVRHL